MKKNKPLLVLLCAGMFILLAPEAKTATNADRVKAQAREQVKVRQKTQKVVDRNTDRRLKIADRLETLQKELKATRRRRQKTDAYVKDMEERVTELQRRVQELERLGQELEPFLDQVSQRLQSFIDQDIPFSSAERQKRLSTLHQSLNRYGAPINDKLRRLLEVLQIEARYGATISTQETELNIAGSRKLVHVFRLGRLALFAFNPDGTQAWRFDQAKGRFFPMGAYQNELSLAADIAARKKVVDLVDLPVGQPSSPAQAEESKQ